MNLMYSMMFLLKQPKREIYASLTFQLLGHQCVLVLGFLGSPRRCREEDDEDDEEET